MNCAVYILTNDRRTVLYTGVTSDLVKRSAQHKLGWSPTAFTKKYNVHRLVYLETTSDITAAIRREKQIKGWLRSKKVALIEAMNPTWRDLFDDWESLAS
jgi:putative endonuclease